MILKQVAPSFDRVWGRENATLKNDIYDDMYIEGTRMLLEAVKNDCPAIKKNQEVSFTTLSTINRLTISSPMNPSPFNRLKITLKEIPPQL